MSNAEKIVMDYELISKSPQQTIEFGKKLGQNLRGSEIIGLIGPLGSGKTHLIKGIAAGAGAEHAQRNVNSPTFVIVNEYQGRLSIYHIDAYRLNSTAEFEMLGFDDYCGRDCVVLIEWADKILPALDGVDLIRIELSHLALSDRVINISNAPHYLVKDP
jgi:tRNA threonylcarbamoyladenosine biosynthesis protein TsaE